MNELNQITYLSRMDHSMQPALVYPACGQEVRPLAVCLHTWSYGLESPKEHFLKHCKERNWHFIFPYFRGRNNQPEACGSDLVVSDLECAVEYMKENYAVDNNRIYLVGGSGGGHASLLLAARKPELWSAVSSWCPISDIAAWYAQTSAPNAVYHMKGYAGDIFEACGGNPISCPQAAEQAKYRSPLSWLSNARGKVILDISTGIHDGHEGSVPISHAILAFNEVAQEEDRISPADIAFMVEKEEVPIHLQFHGEDSSYGHYKVLFRRVSGLVRLTIFDGAHDLLPAPAFVFLEHQARGKEPAWDFGGCLDVEGTELSR